MVLPRIRLLKSLVPDGSRPGLKHANNDGGVCFFEKNMERLEDVRPEKESQPYPLK